VGKHETGFARVDRDLYPTPSWVVAEGLAAHVDLAGMRAWEHACGTGQMSEALKAAGASVYSTDIQDHGYAGLDAVVDFVDGPHPDIRFNALITNPPFGPRAKLAERFIEVGLQRIADCSFMALLLPTDFDSAKTRRHLFAGCPHFAGRIILTRRIKWFELPPGEERKSPKENHAWYLWSRNVILGRQPVVLYAPRMPEGNR
jgi:hypothetical protein